MDDGEEAGMRIGSRGWELPGWEAGFYPETLPEAWRLVYYANEFRTVLIPDSVWRPAGVEEVIGWLEEVNDAFRPWLEITGEPEEALALLEAAGERLAGALLEEGVPPASLERFPEGVEVRHAALPDPERGVWRPGAGGGFSVGIADASHGDLRRLREIVEGFLDPALPLQTLFLEGAADPRFLHQAEVIAALLTPGSPVTAK